jgi:hypothetical protein
MIEKRANREGTGEEGEKRMVNEGMVKQRAGITKDRNPRLRRQR